MRLPVRQEHHDKQDDKQDAQSREDGGIDQLLHVKYDDFGFCTHFYSPYFSVIHFLYKMYVGGEENMRG